MSKFTESFEYWTEGLHIMPGATHTCGGCNPEGLSEGDYDRESCDEGGFSWSRCDTCGSAFGGDRYPAHAFVENDPGKGLIHYDVCVDCLMFIANGDEPGEWRQHPREGE